ncbi:hypothetical protein [Alteromonas gilva]|uniref:Uncharacterized protein n=1 Tax=Alteromonas gilva TaxID=2987522 RepID=A0ABT5L727_9ALTE|nr:hypothetical protein [Alteromonas gilva]MDC8832844.1 hypothetical protein [Alteromonas gilva]
MGTLSLQELASEFGTHDHCLESWMSSLSITDNEIAFALAQFTKDQRRTIIIECIRPAQYLVDHPELINHVQRIGVDAIKALPVNVYEAHLAQLKETDQINNSINLRRFPYQDYDAEVFCTLRHAKKKTDIDFIKKMFGRSISHHSYPAAKRKLTAMALQFMA